MIHNTSDMGIHRHSANGIKKFKSLYAIVSIVASLHLCGNSNLHDLIFVGLVQNSCQLQVHPCVI